MKKPLIPVMALLALLSALPVRADSGDQVTKTLAETVAKAIDAAGKKKVSVLDFRDLQDNTSAFGRASAEDLSNELVNTKKKFAVLDRANLREILKEMQLSDTGLINRANAQKFGQLSGVDALVVGQVVDGQDEVSVSVKVISMDTSEILGAAKGKITKTKDIQNLLATTLVTGGQEQPAKGTDSANSTTTTDQTKAGAATKTGGDQQAADFKLGAKLDVWLSPKDYKGGIPSEPSISTLTDTSGIFNMGAYTGSAGMKGNIGQPVILRWQCYLKITKPGKHLILADFLRKKGSAGSFGDWNVQFTLNGKKAVDQTVHFENDYNGDATLKTQTLSLDFQPGFQPIEVMAWTTNQPYIMDHRFCSFILRMREPGADEPRDIGPNDIFYKPAK